MGHVLHVGDFNTKIVDDKAENNILPDVTPEARGVLTLVVALCRQLLFEELVGDDAGLGEAVHSFSNFNVYPSFFVDQVPEVVLYDDFFRDDVESGSAIGVLR